MNSVGLRTDAFPCTPVNRGKTVSAFTLIELLVVVAVIAILAAIAVPNMLEAQTRSKVAATKSDERILAGALEAYCADSNHYPPGSGTGFYYRDPFSLPVSTRFVTLTTPVAYLTSVPKERFVPREGWMQPDGSVFDSYDYVTAYDVPTRGSGISSGGTWRISSAGPDLYQAYGGRPIENREANEKGADYDPTNGSVSPGDIVRVGTLHTALGDPRDPNNPDRPGIVRAPEYVEQWK